MNDNSLEILNPEGWVGWYRSGGARRLLKSAGTSVVMENGGTWYLTVEAVPDEYSADFWFRRNVSKP